jgi:hypothetical protein
MNRHCRLDELINSPVQTRGGGEDSWWSRSYIACYITYTLNVLFTYYLRRHIFKNKEVHDQFYEVVLRIKECSFEEQGFRMQEPLIEWLV